MPNAPTKVPQLQFLVILVIRFLHVSSEPTSDVESSSVGLISFTDVSAGSVYASASSLYVSDFCVTGAAAFFSVDFSVGFYAYFYEVSVSSSCTALSSS